MEVWWVRWLCVGVRRDVPNQARIGLKMHRFCAENGEKFSSQYVDWQWIVGLWVSF